MSDKVQTKVYLPPDVKALLDADRRSNSEAVEAALITEYGGEKDTALERRIEEKERRISNLTSVRNEREREIEEAREELEGLRKKKEHTQQVMERERENVFESLNQTPADPNNPGIKRKAESLGMTPEELVTELEEWRNGN